MSETINLGNQILYFNSVNKLNEAEYTAKYHKQMLFSVYHFWKKSLDDFRKKGITTFIDSGGFQIKSNTDRNYFPLKDATYWQLMNGDVTAIRDFGLTNRDADMSFKLKDSLYNANYILDMKKELQSETKVLGVIHGDGKQQREKWSKEFLKIGLDGFAFGAVYKLVDTEGIARMATDYDMFLNDLLFILQENKELKWGHFFALTEVELIGMLPYLYDRVNNETNFKLGKISWDNSSPQTAAYLYNYITQDVTWRISKRLDDDNSNKNTVTRFDTDLPCHCDVCFGKKAEDIYNMGAKDMGYHNLITYLSKIRYIFLLYNNNLTKWEDYISKSNLAMKMKGMIDDFVETGKVKKDLRQILG